MILNLENNKIYLGRNAFNIELTQERLKLYNKKFKRYKNSQSVFINTIFSKFLLNRYYIIDDIIKRLDKNKTYKIRKISLSNLLLLNFIDKNEIVITKNIVWLILKSLNRLLIVVEKILIFIYFVITLLYILKKHRKKGIYVDDKSDNVVEILFDKASLLRFNKYNKYKKNFPILILDDRNIEQKHLKNINYLSIYALVSRKLILKESYKLLCKCFAEYNCIIKDLKEEFCISRFHEIMIYIIPRLMHTIYIQYSLEVWFHKNHLKITQILSGLKDERFSKVIMTLAEEYNIETICLPHGLAYNIRYPHGLFGDYYYTTTKREMNILCDIYKNSDKFNFSHNMNEILYNHYYCKKNINIVYFTESRNIKLDREILNVLSSNIPTLKVKLHPSDKKINYPEIKGEDFIDDFEEAISSNVVIARNSTILMEAIYNNSIPISILLTFRDKFTSDYLIPSLSDSRILKVYSINDLVIKIEDKFKKMMM